MEKKKQLDLIIANVNKTISSIEGGINMDDKEKVSSYYDQHQSGAAEFLRDAILIYTGKTNNVS